MYLHTLIACLPQAERAALVQATELRSYRRNESVLAAGEWTDCIYCVASLTGPSSRVCVRRLEASASRNTTMAAPMPHRKTRLLSRSSAPGQAVVLARSMIPRTMSERVQR